MHIIKYSAILPGIFLMFNLVAEPYKTLEGPESDVETVVFTPDGDYLYAAGWDNEIFVYSWPDGELVNQFRAHHSAIYEIQFSKDGNYFMTSSNDNTARLWETGNEEHLHTFSDHSEPVKSAAISPENQYIITASEDGSIKVYDRDEDFEKLTSLDLEGEEGNSVTFEPNRGMIVKATTGNIAKMVQPGNFNTVREFTHDDGVNDVHFIKDGTKIITGSDDQKAKIWDPVDDELLTTLEGHTWRVLSVHLDEDGEYAVTASNDGSARLWDAESGEELEIFELDRRTVVRSATLSPDKKHVISSAQIREPGQYGIIVWDSGISFEEENEENGESENGEEETAEEEEQ